MRLQQKSAKTKVKTKQELGNLKAYFENLLPTKRSLGCIPRYQQKLDVLTNLTDVNSVQRFALLSEKD